MTNPVDVVIATRGRGDLIDVTIASVRASHRAAWSLWIVDQSEDDATERAVMRHARADARINYVRVQSRGISAARNAGVAASSAPIIAFTDDDCRVAPDWLDQLAREFESAETWAVFGRVIPDSEFHSAALDEAQNVSPALPLALKDGATRVVYQHNRFNLGFGHGANMATARARLIEIGGYDEMLGVGAVLRSWPERDLGYRMLARGARIVYTPNARVYHRHWRGWNEVRRTYQNYAIGAGAAVGKYIRCGDWRACYILGEWFFDQGWRQIFSGIFKWQSWQKIQIGWIQLIYPWIGVWQGARYPVERARVVYQSSGELLHRPHGLV